MSSPSQRASRLADLYRIVPFLSNTVTLMLVMYTGLKLKVSWILSPFGENSFGKDGMEELPVTSTLMLSTAVLPSAARDVSVMV